MARFGNVKATIVYDEADATKSTVTATIGVDTVNTGVDARNTHLKSPDFFDIATMPTATFNSTSVAKNGNHLSVTRKPGRARRHQARGARRGWPERLDDRPKGKVHTGFSATTTIDRTAFGIGTKFPAAMVGTMSHSISSWKS